jgi:hypothetical protein
MRTALVLTIALSGLLLAGCENDSASFQDADQQGQSLTLIREQHRFWNDNAEVALVVARLPDCQRRHALGSTPPDKARVEVFRADERRYLVKQGESWFQADAGSCQLAASAAPAASAKPVLLGAFEKDDGRLRFKAAGPPAR